jgi:hypothetical protein
MSEAIAAAEAGDLRLRRCAPPSRRRLRVGVDQVNPSTEPFVAGPLPLGWLTRVALCRGAAPAVCLALAYQRGLDRRMTVVPQRRLLAEMGVSVEAEERALAKLEAQGLVRVERHRGRRPRVTLLWPQLSVRGRHDPA